MERGPEDVVLRAVRLSQDAPAVLARIDVFGPAWLACGDEVCRLGVRSLWQLQSAGPQGLVLSGASVPGWPPVRFEADVRDWAPGMAFELLDVDGGLRRRLQFRDARGRERLSLEWRDAVPVMAWERLLACGSVSEDACAVSMPGSALAGPHGVPVAWRQGCETEVLHRVLHEAMLQRLLLQVEVCAGAARMTAGFVPEQVEVCMRRHRLSVRGSQLDWGLDESRLAGLDRVGRISARGLCERLEFGGGSGGDAPRACLGPLDRPGRGDPCGWRLALQQALD